MKFKLMKNRGKDDLVDLPEEIELVFCPSINDRIQFGDNTRKVIDIIHSKDSITLIMSRVRTDQNEDDL